jgi:hypothetical protein
MPGRVGGKGSDVYMCDVVKDGKDELQWRRLPPHPSFQMQKAY